MAQFLIVEDDPAVSEAFARMLRLGGHVVREATTASQAFESVALEPIDAVILDIRLPQVSGVEFLRQIRRDPRLEHLPVGIVTGDYFLKEDVLDELDRLGASVRYKPLWLADVSELANELLSPGAGAHRRHVPPDPR